MSMTGFLVFLLLPSMAFVFVVLTTFYGARRAYFAISWIPLTLFLLVFVFRQLFNFQHAQGLWAGELFQVVGWASLVQALLGGGLIIRAYRKRQSCIGLVVATCMTALPFIIRAWN